MLKNFQIKNVEKFSNWSILGRLADSPFFKSACKLGPQIHEMPIWKFDHSGLIGRHPPPICSKWPKIWGPKYKSWHFFQIVNPLSIWILYMKLMKIFQIGPFWADWQTPFSKRPPIWDLSCPILLVSLPLYGGGLTLTGSLFVLAYFNHRSYSSVG